MKPNRNIAVLLTCHNRREKTLTCLHSLFHAEIPEDYSFEVFLVEDGCSDGTGEAVKEAFPSVNIIQGNGNLFWAGGMRLAWKTSLKKNKYNAYLLLNDDVELNFDFIDKLIETEKFSLQKTGKKGIYSGATMDKKTREITYGGTQIIWSHITIKARHVEPQEVPQFCDITNANILWVNKDVVHKIGVFDEKFTHGIADYDYSLRARKKGFPVLLAPGICGFCENDHGVNWKNSNTSLKERIVYLKSPLGLAYEEYLFYIKRHFPLNLPYSFVMLWMKTFFPGIWDKFKVD